MMAALPTKQLSHNGPSVPAMGLGLMGLSAFYNDTAEKSDETHFKILDAAHAAGQVLWDSADVYGERYGTSKSSYS